MSFIDSTRFFKHTMLLATFATILSGCADSNNNNYSNDGSSDNPFNELVEQGATRYLGEFSPMSTEENASDSTLLNHRFANSGNSPMCVDSTEYAMSTRDTGSEDLLIFLQGGGACWEDFPYCNQTADPTIPSGGILNTGLANNPVASWNVAYFPYCDGGVFASDQDYPEPDAFYPSGRFHHGLQNLSAGLDVTVRAFPSPRRILLAGTSGGGFGTIFALPLVRSLYPGVPIELINDSGVAVGKPDEPEFFLDRLDYWNVSDSFLPASCPDCIAEDGHGTGFHIWSLTQDPNLRLSLMSYTQDGTIAGFFFEVPGPIWQEALLEEMAEVEAAHPDRVRSFIAPGTSHTFLRNDTNPVIEGISVLEWVTGMLEDSEDWTSVQEL
jgi:hypothetical protein